MGRGLSPVQHAIMKQARLCGYITPAQAVELGSYAERLDDVRSTASRALRRLCVRGLLVKEWSGYWKWGWRYRLAGWSGPLPSRYLEIMNAPEKDDFGDMTLRLQAMSLGQSPMAANQEGDGYRSRSILTISKSGNEVTKSNNTPEHAGEKRTRQEILL
jgi:hypothetical protein